MRTARQDRRDLKEAQSDLTVAVAVIQSTVTDIKSDVSEIKRKMEAEYATKEWTLSEFGQTRRIVNALMGTFATAIVLAIAAFIIRGGIK